MIDHLRLSHIGIFKIFLVVGHYRLQILLAKKYSGPPDLPLINVTHPVTPKLRTILLEKQYFPPLIITLGQISKSYIIVIYLYIKIRIYY